MPSVLDCIEGNNSPLRTLFFGGKEGVVSGGVVDQSTHEEDGPVTWEALASPRHIPVERRAGDPSPTHDTLRAHVSSAQGGTEQAFAPRVATARGTGAVADGGRELEGGRGVMRSGNGQARWTRPSTGGPC